jgi:hypothetical protein
LRWCSSPARSRREEEGARLTCGVRSLATQKRKRAAAAAPGPAHAGAEEKRGRKNGSAQSTRWRRAGRLGQASKSPAAQVRFLFPFSFLI